MASVVNAKENEVIRTIEVRRHLGVLLLGTIAIAATVPVSAEEDKADGKWHFSVTPYLWLPSINGTVTYTNPAGTSGSISAQLDPGSYLQSLDFAGMVTGGARKDRWLVFTDYMYIHFGNHQAATQSVTGPGGVVAVPINTGGDFSTVMNVWTLAGGYTVLYKASGFLDVFAGTRLLDMSTTINWNFAGATGGLAQSGSASQKLNEWDGIVGFKGEVRFGESQWFMPYYADVGAGSNNWTWQAALGVGYRFGWGDLVFAWRTLSYNFNDNQLNIRMTGPALGASFKF